MHRSGSEEEYSELNQLLEDIATYRRDMHELKTKQTEEKEQKKRKEMEDKKKGLEMRQAAIEGMSSKLLMDYSDFYPHTPC